MRPCLDPLLRVNGLFCSKVRVVPSPSYLIRRARVIDGEAVLGIERVAASRFASIGMHDIANGVGLSKLHYDRFVALGAVFLCELEAQPVGFVAACLVDDACHIAELDVLPAHAGQRLGSRLIDAAASWAREQGLARLTLTTFRHVPWNQPYYSRLGFVPVTLDELGSGHRAIWEGQRDMGLDMRQRLLMTRPA